MAYVIQTAEKKKVVTSERHANQIRDRIAAQMPEIYITRVEVVNNNKYLHAAYQLRKAHFQLLHRYSSPTEDLYHATASNNVQSILKDNLDWRRVRRSRFGVGVSFSNNPEYANKYCNNNNGSFRAFVVCEVLTGNALQVGQNSNYPRSNIDTYQSKSRLVIVKFEDNSFYPKYVIYYQTTPPNPYRPLSTDRGNGNYKATASSLQPPKLPNPYRPLSTNRGNGNYMATASSLQPPKLPNPYRPLSTNRGNGNYKATASSSLQPPNVSQRNQDCIIL